MTKYININGYKMECLKNEIQKLAFGLIIYILSFSQIGAQTKTINFDDSWGKDGFEITDADSSKLHINFSIKQLYISDTMIDGIKMQNINIGNIYLPNEAGAPNLPRLSKFIAIPQNSKPLVKIISYRTEIYQNFTIAPASKIQIETDNKIIKNEINEEIYISDKYYPSEFVSQSDPLQIRNLDCFMLGICPFQFNPVTKELKVFKDIKIEISFEGGNGHFGNDAYRSHWFDRIFQDAILNYSSLPNIDYNKRYNSNSKLTGCEYIIISPSDPEFLKWADSLKKFRTEQGIITQVVSLADIPNSNTADGIKSWIENAYQTWEIKPVAVLLLADFGFSTNNRIISSFHKYQGGRICATDNFYADINKDYLPDLIISRLPVENEEQLQIMVSKCLNYERNPPTESIFYEQPITSMGWDSEFWYQICAESVGGFWKYKLHKNPTRVNAFINGNLNVDPWSYASNSLPLINLFGENNLHYIPNNPKELGGFEGGNSTAIINAINIGSFMTLHRDHGSETSWNYPYFDINDINQLSNKDLSFIFSIDCSTGKFDYYEACLAEKFMRSTNNNENTGAIGIIAASGPSFPFISDVYLWGIIDNFWPDFLPESGSNHEVREILPAFGSVAGKYFLKNSSWLGKSDLLDATFNLFHMFGDAFQLVYSELPGNLNVMHNPFLAPGVDHFNIKADSGSIVVITANEQIISITEGIGSPQEIKIPPQTFQTKIVITVTKPNYKRYRSEIDTRNLNGPYFYLLSNFISDPIPLGNNNGLIENGETNFLNIKIKNIGNESGRSFSMELKSSDPYIEIENPKVFIDELPVDSIVSLIDFFKFKVAKNIPDNQKIMLNLTITKGNDRWNYEINKTANAPFLVIEDIVFTDKLPGGNNNGILESYEKIEFTMSSANKGHSNINNLTGVLKSSDPNIEIENDCHIDQLNANETKKVKFSVRINENVSSEPLIFNFKLYSESYQTEKEYSKTANIYYEDWETNNFCRMPWKLSGNSNWIIVSGNEKYEGYFSAKSGPIGDLEESNLDITFTSAEDDTIYFYKKVSSEACDFLKFYIDDLKTPVIYWSGVNKKWTLVKFPVNAGTHLYRWQYAKNWRLSGGNDCAWIDCIVFPKSANKVRYPKTFEDNLECFPNPCDNMTTISFSVNEETSVSLYLFNTYGEKVFTISENTFFTKGYHQIPLMTKYISSGLYYLVMQVNEKIFTQKIVINKTEQ